MPTGLFWLVYTDVKRFDGNFKDAHNYIVTAPAIEGPWSDPVYVNSSGFDPSLFHDEDGRKWFLNMLWDHRPHAGRRHPAFAGILCQEWDAAAAKLIGAPKLIFEGSPHGLVEGPHLFKRRGWYYLITAEGGTGYDHVVTLARSRVIDGPYELHPNRHLLTSKDAPQARLQRAGHGQIVETPAGPYLVHLCSRPLPGLRRSPLGRETAIQKCVWRDDDWLYLNHGGCVPADEVEPPVRQRARAGAAGSHELSRRALCRRSSNGCARRARSGYSRSTRGRESSRLIGRESIGSWFEQALVARRQQHFAFRAETEVEFAPTTFQQAAGLALYYNRSKFHFLALTADDSGARVLTVMSCLGDPAGRLTFPARDIAVGAGAVRLRARVDGAALQFAYAVGAGAWTPCGPTLDASIVSDEAGGGEHSSFTGAFIGLCAFDVSGLGAAADFSYFDYAPED